jgi:hypothetical protein
VQQKIQSKICKCAGPEQKLYLGRTYIGAFEPTYDPLTQTLHGSNSLLIPKFAHAKSIGQQIFESLKGYGNKITQVNI